MYVERRVLLVSLVQLAQLDNLVSKVTLEERDSLALMDLLGFRVHLEIEVSLEILEFLVPLVL